MLTFWTFISAVILVTPSLCANTVADCQGTTLKPGEADAILKLINAARDKLRRGEQRNGLTGFNLPAAVSMPDLEWNCAAEKNAVDAMTEYCKDPDKYYDAAEAMTIPQDNTEVQALHRINFLLKTMDFVELETVVNGSVRNGKVVYDGHLDLTGFAGLANYEAKSITCARHKCTIQKKDTHLLQCRTDVPMVNTQGVLYHAKADSNACPSNAYVDDSVRKAFLQKHNTLRTTLALGTVKNGNTGKMLGQAKNMPSLVYDCDLEKIAYERAKLCENYDQAGADTFKENYFNYTQRINRDQKKAARMATQSWWSTLSGSNGIDEFENLYYANQNYNSFAKIASDLTTKVGCAIYNCTNSVNIVCRYDTTLVHGSSLYESGPRCSGCPKACSNGLCQATVAGAKI